MATQAVKEEKQVKEETEKTAIERFMELEGSDLVVPPNALSTGNRMRAMGLLAGMGEEIDELSYGDVFNGVADCVEFLERKVAKNRPAFSEFIDGLDDDAVIEYCMSYLTAVGER